MSSTSFTSILFASIFLFLISCSEEPTPTAVENKKTTINGENKKNKPTKQPLVTKNVSSVTIETIQFKSLTLGEQFVFRYNNQGPIFITIDKHRTDANGTTFLSGTHKGVEGTYQLTATAGDSITYGRIQTPDTTYTFTVKEGKTSIVDLQEPGNELVPKNPNDAKIPSRGKENDTSLIGVPAPTTPPMENSAPSIIGKTTIDLMVVYSDGFAAKHTGDTLMTRLNHLVSVANTLYANSNVNIYLRLVYSAQVSYPDNTTNNSALTNLTAGNGVFSTIESLRQEHGADLVSFIRPYDSSNHAGCGIAWLLGTNSYGFTYDSDHAYSVVSDGSEKVGYYTYYCSEQTLAHELGHNMGSAHDRANSSNPGAYAYSYGYGINNNFGTVMSYISPEIDFFSNPAVTCDAGPPALPCGVNEAQSNSANNALSLNNTAAAIAGFVSAKYSADIDSDGQTTITDTVKSLILLSGQSITGTVDSKQDINDDGKIGLAEAIHSLQKSKQ